MTATTDLDALLDALAARAAERARARPPLRNRAGEVVPTAGPTGRLQVASGDDIVAVWGNTTFDQTAECFASAADRDTQWPAPQDGAVCYTADAACHWHRRSGVWQPIAAAGQPPVAAASALVTATDAAGQVWIAKGGVAGGVWRPARDVLAFNVHKGTAQAISAGTLTKVTYDTVDRDPYALFSVSGSTFTAPVAGRYAVAGRCEVTFTSAAWRAFSSLYQNGAEVRRGQDITAAASTLSDGVATGQLYLAAGDVLDLRFFTSVAGNTTTTRYQTYLDVSYMGTG